MGMKRTQVANGDEARIRTRMNSKPGVVATKILRTAAVVAMVIQTTTTTTTTTTTKEMKTTKSQRQQRRRETIRAIKKKLTKAQKKKIADENDDRPTSVIARLQELGPRFTLKLMSVQRGTFDSKHGEFEYVRSTETDGTRKTDESLSCKIFLLCMYIYFYNSYISYMFIILLHHPPRRYSYYYTRTIFLFPCHSFCISSTRPKQ